MHTLHYSVPYLIVNCVLHDFRAQQNQKMIHQKRKERDLQKVSILRIAYT